MLLDTLELIQISKPLCSPREYISVVSLVDWWSRSFICINFKY